MKKKIELLEGKIFVMKGGEKTEFESLTMEEREKVFTDANRRYAEQWAAREGLEVESIELISKTSTA